MFENIEQLAPDWWGEAACRGIGSSIFFGDDDNHTSLRRARKICSKCPVSRDCLEHALVVPEEYGIWAGTSARNRQKMARAIESGMEIDEIVGVVLTNRFRWRDEQR